MSFRPLPDIDLLNELLNYDPLTGEFTWKVGRGRARKGAIAGNHRPDGYRYIKINREYHYAHRLAWLIMTGNGPGEYQIDHIDGNRHNNKFSNLRLATNSQNGMNSKIQSNNTTGIKGLYLDKQRKKWAPEITVNGKRHFKRFKSRADAIRWLHKTREALHDHFHRHG